MAFRVERGEVAAPVVGSDADTLHVSEGGVVRIERADGRRHYLGPNQWTSIDETPPRG